MKKKTKKLIIAVAVLLLLVLALLLVKNFVKEPEDTTDTETETYDVATVSAEELTYVNITVKTVNEVSADTDSSAVESSAVSSGSTTTIKKLNFKVKDDKTGWVWSEDENVPLSNDVFSDMVYAIDEAESTVKLEEVTAEKLAEFGLSDPYVTVEFGFEDSARTFLVGKKNTYNSQYYFCDAESKSTVYMVSDDVVSYLDIEVSDALEWDELPSISAAKIQGIEFLTPEHTYSYKYYASGNDNDYTDKFYWYLSIDGAAEFPVASALSTGLTTAMSGMYFEDCVHFTGEIPAEYGFAGSTAMTLKYAVAETIEDDDGNTKSVDKNETYVLNLGVTNEDGYYYCKTNDSQLVYLLVYSDVFESALATEERLLRPTEIISLNMDRVDKVKFTASSSVLEIVMTRESGSTTYADASGKDFNETNFNAIIDGLTGVTATSNTAVVEAVSSSGNDVIFSAEFTFNAGTTSSAVLEIRNYSEAYRQVSFMGRDDQLITATDAKALIALVCDYYTD